jgi:DNA-binding GntR family transcriptional regulator
MMDLQALNDAIPQENEGARTLAEMVTVRLREAILLGRLPPGTQLSQDVLARQFGVSRVPLREALKNLDSEGLVEWRAHRGAVVTGLSPADLVELYVLGAVLESTLAEQACKLASDEHIAKVGKLVDAMSDPGISATEWHAVNREFHSQLVAPAKWPRFERMIADVRANTGRYVKAYLESSGNIHRWSDEHQKLYRCYRERDGAGLVDAIREHWAHTSDVLQHHLNAARETKTENDAK